MTERVEEIRRRVDGLPAGPWESPFHAYEAYPPLGESDLVFAPTKEIADFLAHAREDVPYLLTALAQAERERLIQIVKAMSIGISRVLIVEAQVNDIRDQVVAALGGR